MDIKTKISNKIAVITGGLGGIGFQTVQHLLKNGVEYIAMFDLPKSNDEKVLKSLQDLEKKFNKNKFGYFSCDVSNKHEFKANFDMVVELKKRVDIFINNAGIINEKQLDLSIDINYKAVVVGTLMAIDHMRTDKGGKGGVIVNIASTAGLRNFSIFPVYNSTKHAVVSFVRSLKNFNKSLGVNVVCLCPNLTNTPLANKQELPKKLLDFVDGKVLSEYFKTAYMQKPESVAIAVMEIINKGDYGAVWIVSNDVTEGVREINEVDELSYKLE
ncbi:alcohol dehydrogenase 1-like [Copidosoma floridanum]|uniref:alcohol dehydrogenase 1-like n=1 Tax=Copidosoma floridanum TaxID=29053 RepID=UPI0006C99074|nr:alcohol dehydrogenase 1-like [Copidosoma floridanum]